MALLALLVASRLLAAAALQAATPPPAAQNTLENEVKAAFLYNFTKFVEWPPDRLHADHFRVCVVGDRAFTAALDGIIAGEEAYGRPLRRYEPQSPEDARRCQVLYLGDRDPELAARMLAAVRQWPVLTVGESPRLHALGLHISFVRVDNKVRFDASVAAADRSGLRISSKLLRVARSVDAGGVR